MEKLRNRANKLMKTEIALYDQELADPLPQPPCAYVKRRPQRLISDSWKKSQILTSRLLKAEIA